MFSLTNNIWHGPLNNKFKKFTQIPKKEYKYITKKLTGFIVKLNLIMMHINRFYYRYILIRHNNWLFFTPTLSIDSKYTYLLKYIRVLIMYIDVSW